MKQEYLCESCCQLYKTNKYKIDKSEINTKPTTPIESTRRLSGQPYGYLKNIAAFGHKTCPTCMEKINIKIETLMVENRPINLKHISRRVLEQNTDKLLTYTLRDIPNHLWNNVKQQSIRDKVPIRSIIIHALLNYLGDN